MKRFQRCPSTVIFESDFNAVRVPILIRFLLSTVRIHFIKFVLHVLLIIHLIKLVVSKTTHC